MAPRHWRLRSPLALRSQCSSKSNSRAAHAICPLLSYIGLPTASCVRLVFRRARACSLSYNGIDAVGAQRLAAVQPQCASLKSL